MEAKKSTQRGQTKRHYDEDYKRQAVALTLQEGRKVNDVAAELGVNLTMLYAWRRQYAPQPARGTRAPQTLEEKDAEIARLRAELVRMQQREVVLKKIAGHPLRNARERYAQIEAMKGAPSTQMLCELLDVSRSGYYRWKQRRPTRRQTEDAALSTQILAAHRRGRRNYGAPRIVEQLRAHDTRISKRRCARLMKAQGLRGRKKHRRRPRTTDSAHAHVPAANLLAQRAAPTAPDQVWITDITYIKTGEGWLYLAAILDGWSRRVVGWACSTTLHVTLVMAALDRACRDREPPPGLLHHSDRGVQYAGSDYRAGLAAAHMICSMSRKANCYDNASMESFWSTLKTETGLDEAVPISRRAAELIIFDYIETFYNPTRRHSSLGYLSPVAFEKRNQPAA